MIDVLHFDTCMVGVGRGMLFESGAYSTICVPRSACGAQEAAFADMHGLTDVCCLETILLFCATVYTSKSIYDDNSWD